MSKRVIIVSFSSRVNGNCAKISNFIRKQNCGDLAESYQIDDAGFAPCNHCDYECLKPGKVCPNLSERQISIMDALCGCDLIYFVVPNYCGGPSANYYAFNERTVGYFNQDREKLARYMVVPKRFIIVSNTEGFESAMMQQTRQAPEILYLKTSRYKKNSIAGDLLDSEEARADLAEFLERDL